MIEGGKYSQGVKENECQVVERTVGAKENQACI